MLITALPAAASDALKRCRSIQDPAARLACYDALPVDESRAPQAAQAAQPAPPAPGPRPATPAPRAATPPPAVVAPAPQAAPTPQSPAPPTQATLESTFGIEGRAPSAELPSIQSHIPGTFLGWSQYSRIRLANGQVWQVIDEGSRRMQLQDPKVRVRRGMMGAFYLEFEAHNHAPRVRRVE